METTNRCGEKDNVKLIVYSGFHHVGTQGEANEVDETDEKKAMDHGVESFEGKQRNNPNTSKEGEEPSRIFHGPVGSGGEDVREEVKHRVWGFKKFARIVAKNMAEDEAGCEPKGGLGEDVGEQVAVFPQEVGGGAGEAGGEDKAG